MNLLRAIAIRDDEIAARRRRKRLLAAGGGATGEGSGTYYGPAAPDVSAAIAERYIDDAGADFLSAYTGLPLGVTADAGDLIIIIFSMTDAASTSVGPADFTKLGEINCLSVYWKEADGTEAAADTFGVTFNTLTRMSWATYRISNPGAGGLTGTLSAGGTVDPPSHSPAGGAAEYIWITALAFLKSAGQTLDPATTAAPSGYGNLTHTQNFPEVASGSRGGLSVADKTATAASDDPGTFTQTAAAAYGSSCTLAIPTS